MGAGGCNYEDNGEHPCGVPTLDYGEEGNTAIRCIMLDTVIQGGAMLSGVSVGIHVHIPSACDGITVGGLMISLEGMSMVKQLLGGK